MRLATAESCTGGLIASQITSVPGAAAVFIGALVSYANSVKQQLLGVDETILTTHGAVSQACAEAMSQGARRIFIADWAISTTGIAGPSGGTTEKPVGLVWFAVSSASICVSQSQIFTGDRAAIRQKAVNYGVSLLNTIVKKHLNE